MCALLREVGVELVIGVDPVPARRELAARFGASTVLGPDADVVATVRRLSGGVHVAFEVAGAQAAFDQALACLRSGGELMLLGLVDRLCLPALDMVNAELRLSTSVGYRDCHAELIDLLAAGRLDLGALVTDVVALADAPDALLRMAADGSRGVKTLVRCGGEER